MFYQLTFIVNFLGLMVALWLGLYLVTRRSRRPEAWLSALALWSLSGYFLNQLLALYPPLPPAPETRAWLYRLILFWPQDVFELGWKGWLFGWLPCYSIIFWYHATLCMLPGPFNRKRLLGAALGYAVALAGVLVTVHFRAAWADLLEDPLYNTLLTLPYYPLFAIGFATFTVLGILNVARSIRTSITVISRAQFWLLTSSALLVGAAGLLGIVTNLLNTRLPQFLTALFLLAALLLAGIVVVSYTAVLDRRPWRRDLLANATGAAVLLAIFVLFLRIFFRPRPPVEDSYIVVGCMAMISHPLINAVFQRILRQYTNKKGRKLIQPQLKTERANESHELVEVSERAVELALRNLHNYAYLANSPLSQLRLVCRRLDGLEKGSDTHIDHGRAVSEVLSEAVKTLKPSPENAPSPAPRTWYPYIILWDAYVECKPNLEIMSRLYISEGTFNRTRKAAISSVAQILAETEAQAK